MLFSVTESEGTTSEFAVGPNCDPREVSRGLWCGVCVFGVGFVCGWREVIQRVRRSRCTVGRSPCAAVFHQPPLTSTSCGANERAARVRAVCERAASMRTARA